MSDRKYTGPFAKTCEDFISQKRAVGYRYEEEARILWHFDQYAARQNDSGERLSKELVMGWTEKSPYEADKSWRNRLGAVRIFAAYLRTICVEAYILPPVKKSNSYEYAPYIFTDDEIRRLFDTVDKMEFTPISPYVNLVFPVLVRMLYGCGLRISEAYNLRVRDVDIENGILTIWQSKNDNSRLTPMSESLTAMCRDYVAKMPLPPNEDAPFFPRRFGEAYGQRGLYSQFRILLKNAGISHGGRGKGPRIHDFRHTFAVHAMRQLVRNGRNLYVTSPILSAYLGHQTLSATQKYLRLTPDVYPEVVQKFESGFGGVVPEVLYEAD